MLKGSVFRAGIKVAPSVIFAYFSWMIKYGRHPEKYPLEQRYKKLHKLTKKIFDALHGEAHVFGLENLPKETSYFVCNHLNETDPLILLSVLDKPTTFVCKKEIENYPFAAKCVNTIEGEFIDRKDLKASLKTMMKVEEHLRKGDKNWIIYPEGTRNRDERGLLLDFHYGTFKAPYKAQVPIVPICIYGTQRLLDRKYHFKKYPVYIEFGKPLYPDEYKDITSKEIALIIKERIQTMLSYHARQFDKKELVKILGDKYKENY